MPLRIQLYVMFFSTFRGQRGNLPVFGHHRPVVYARPKQVKKNKKSTRTIIIISRGLRTFSLRTENIYKFPHMRPPVNERKKEKSELQRSSNVGGSCYHVV